MKTFNTFERYLTPTTIIIPTKGNPDDFKDILRNTLFP